jgi:hypothetical protein
MKTIKTIFTPWARKPNWPNIEAAAAGKLNKVKRRLKFHTHCGSVPMIYSPIFYSFCHTEQFPEPEPAVAPSGPRGRCASQLQDVQAVSSSWIVNFVKQLNAMDGDSVVRSSYPSCMFFFRGRILLFRCVSCRTVEPAVVCELVRSSGTTRSGLIWSRAALQSAVVRGLVYTSAATSYS